MSVEQGIRLEGRKAWRQVTGVYGLKTNALTRNVSGRGIRVGFNVFGDEKLVRQLMRGPPVLAKEFKKMRRKVATKVIVPAIKNQIPRSDVKKRHLRANFRVRRVQLEGTWIAAGSRKFFYAAAVNARTPFVLRGLQDAEKRYVRVYSRALEDFARWVVTGRPITVNYL